MNKIKLNYLLLGIVVLIVTWFISSKVIDNEIVVPEISDVLVSLKNILANSYSYIIILNTLLKLFLAVILSFLFAMIFSLSSYYSVKIESFLKPFFITIKTVPIASIIIILLLMVGNKLSPYLITIFVILPIMYETFLTSYRSIDVNIIDELKLISKVNIKVIFSIFLPLIYPYIITSFIQSIGLGLKVMVMAEFITQPKDTMGYALMHERYSLNTSNIFAWTIILIIFVLILEIVIKKIKTIYPYC